MKKIFTEHIDGILKTLPTSPGVYQMKDTKDEVIYVGKAKNLKNRVNSYFARTEDLNMAKRQMVGKIADIQVTLTSSEVEALVLETNLIKHLRPKYNILMKDDKNLAYIKITKGPIPEIIKTRQKIRDGAEYYGPYVSAVEQSIRALRRIFKIRNCRVKFETRKREGTRELDTISHDISISDKTGKSIPCMDYYIGICPGPCLLEEDKIDTHNQNIASLRSFLRGDALDVFASLEVSMKQYAKNLEFEEAQKIKSTIEALKYLHERQKVRDLPGGDMDIIVMHEKYNRYFIGLTQVRGGQIISVFRHEITTKLGDSTEEILTEFLALQYIGESGQIESDIGLPESIVLQNLPEDESLLGLLGKAHVHIEIPKSGPKHDLLTFTLNQVREYAYKSELATLEQRTLTREHMAHVLERIGYDVPKKGEIVFECYDISHTHGQFTVASRAVIVNGKPDSSRYRKYNIKSLEYSGKIDDFASHKEVMKRRIIEGREQGYFPHLIIIDGGKGQLSSAIQGIKEGIFEYEHNRTLSSITGEENKNPTFDYPSIPICSIAKREEEIFLPGKKDPILFETGTPELMVLQKARDESHRFAITANRQARTKAMKKNILEELPGFGPVTRRKLLKLAGSIDSIKDIPLEELEKICNKKQIETLRDHGLI